MSSSQIFKKTMEAIDFGGSVNSDASLENGNQPTVENKSDYVVCHECKQKIHKDKMMKAFSKCSLVKDFVRRFENIQRFAGYLLIKQQTEELSPEESAQLKKATAVLNNPLAIKRYNQVLEKRKISAEKKKGKKKVVPKSLEEKAQLDDELVIPPLEAEEGEETTTEIEIGMEGICDTK